jgi:hypothetical protein
MLNRLGDVGGLDFFVPAKSAMRNRRPIHPGLRKNLGQVAALTPKMLGSGMKRNIERSFRCITTHTVQG